MYNISMEGQPTKEGLALELKRIAENIEIGFLSGAAPFWEITGQEGFDDDEEEDEGATDDEDEDEEDDDFDEEEDEEDNE